jgi:hypothetical protein
MIFAPALRAPRPSFQTTKKPRLLAAFSMRRVKRAYANPACFITSAA